MYDVDAIEAINIDQLVTATDRILMRAGRMKRTSRPTIDFTHEAHVAVVVSLARAGEDKTVYMRSAPERPFIGVAAFLAAAWLGFTFVCLLA